MESLVKLPVALVDNAHISEAAEPLVQLDLAGEGLALRVPVLVDRTPCHLGGLRTWWRCPSCGDRRRDLLFTGAVLGCRGCIPVAYASQQWGAMMRTSGGNRETQGRPAWSTPVNQAASIFSATISSETTNGQAPVQG